MKCSRFQFQCHSGECIAIYNACDKIPQCMDGSDEGSEVYIDFDQRRQDKKEIAFYFSLDLVSR